MPAIKVENEEQRDTVLEKLNEEGYRWAKAISENPDILSYRNANSNVFPDLYETGFPFYINVYSDKEITFCPKLVMSECIDAESFLDATPELILDEVRELAIEIDSNVKKIIALLGKYCDEIRDCFECSHEEDEMCPARIKAALERLREI